MGDESRRRPRRRRRVLRRAAAAPSTQQPAAAEQVAVTVEPAEDAEPLDADAPLTDDTTAEASSPAISDAEPEEIGVLPPGDEARRSGRGARTARPVTADERGLRDLVGAGPSQVGVSGALRARDVDRPTEEDMAQAERDVVLVRRHWKPPS